MKSVFLLTALLFTLNINSAEATNIKDLALNCLVVYKVQEAKPFFKPAPLKPTRVIRYNEAGVHELIEIMGFEGSACHLLKEGYGINFVPGQTLKYTKHVEGTQFIKDAFYRDAVLLANSELGTVLKAKVSQEFELTDAEGNLPLFPLYHSEKAYVLNQTGCANNSFLYNTPSVLTDAQKLKLADVILSQLEWGTLESWSYSWKVMEFIGALKALEPESLDARKEVLQDLLTVFKNVNKKTSHFTTGGYDNSLAKYIAKLLNLTQGTKWQSKLQVVQNHPLLLDSQLISWAQKGEFLTLTSEQVEEFLKFALERVKALKAVNFMWEANILVSQYQEAAGTLKNNVKPIILSTPLYELSSVSAALIEEILAIK